MWRKPPAEIITASLWMQCTLGGPIQFIVVVTGLAYDKTLSTKFQ